MADTDQEAYTLEDGKERADEKSGEPKVDIEAKLEDGEQVPPQVRPAQGESQESALNLTENARRVLARRYLTRDNEGNVTEEP